MQAEFLMDFYSKKKPAKNSSKKIVQNLRKLFDPRRAEDRKTI